MIALVYVFWCDQFGGFGWGWSSGWGEGWREARRVGSEQTGTLWVIRVLGRLLVEEVMEEDLALEVIEVDGARSEETSDSLVHVVQSLGGEINLQNK